VYKISNIALAALFTFACAMAETSAIGTASARGSMRIDGSVVNGNATLFDGTVVETSEAMTAVRLDKGVEIKLATDSRGKLYSDHLVLEKGAGEVAAPGRFMLQANGLRVTPEAPNSRGVVSFQDSKTVQVSALQGSFDVANDQGILLASVQPGRMLLFNMQDAGATAPTTVTGALTRETDKCVANGGKKYYITVKDTGVKYEVTGPGLDALVGKTVTLTGTLDTSVQPSKCAAGLIAASNVTPVGGGAAAAAGMALKTKWIIAGVAIAAAGATAGGVYAANQSSTSASR